MRKIFTNYLFLLLITLFAFGFLLGNLFGEIQTVGVNKTVGWAYSLDRKFFFSLLFFISQIVFIIGYFIVFILKRKTQYYLSLIHFELILLTLVLMSFENFNLTVIACILSIILFFINIYKSYR